MPSGDGFLLPAEAVVEEVCTPSLNYSIVQLRFLFFQSSMAFFEVTLAPIARRLPSPYFFGLKIPRM